MTPPFSPRFFIGLLAGVLLAAVGFAALLFGQMGAPSADSEWAAAINARKLAAGRRSTAPRILVVGGSGALFGIKARQLESTLGRPALNLASHAALGTGVILDLARRTASRGDTILLVPEYELYDYGTAAIRSWADAVYLDYTLAVEPERLRALPWRDFGALSLRVTSGRLWEGWRHRFRPPAHRVFASYHPYDPANVDAHGDMTGHHAGHLPSATSRSFPVSGTLSHGLATRSGMSELSAFCRWARECGMRVVAAWPAICDDAAYHQQAAAMVVSEIRSHWQASGVPLANEFAASLLPREDFFDTQYHLNEEAATRETAKLAGQLAPYLSEPGPLPPDP